MLKRLSKNKFFFHIFAFLIFISLKVIKLTSDWEGINEEIINKELLKKKIYYNINMASTTYGLNI